MEEPVGAEAVAVEELVTGDPGEPGEAVEAEEPGPMPLVRVVLRGFLCTWTLAPSSRRSKPLIATVVPGLTPVIAVTRSLPVTTCTGCTLTVWLGLTM